MLSAQETDFCPHCNVHARFETVDIPGLGNTGRIRLLTRKNNIAMAFDLTCLGCPACGQIILVAQKTGPSSSNLASHFKWLNILLWPDSATRPIPKEVETEAPNLAADFREATSVLPKSKKASAALARRCLQFILREKGGTKPGNLADQIGEVIDSLPTELGKNVDAIRQIGNFAAHPMKSTNSGEIAEVEEGEAEWLLSILETLFDYYYVAPAQAFALRKSLNLKLKDLNKPTLKQPEC